MIVNYTITPDWHNPDGTAVPPFTAQLDIPDNQVGTMSGPGQTQYIDKIVLQAVVQRCPWTWEVQLDADGPAVIGRGPGQIDKNAA